MGCLWIFAFNQRGYASATRSRFAQKVVHVRFNRLSRDLFVNYEKGTLCLFELCESCFVCLCKMQMFSDQLQSRSKTFRKPVASCEPLHISPVGKEGTEDSIAWSRSFKCAFLSECVPLPCHDPPYKISATISTFAGVRTNRIKRIRPRNLQHIDLSRLILTSDLRYSQSCIRTIQNHMLLCCHCFGRERWLKDSPTLDVIEVLGGIKTAMACDLRTARF